MSKHVLSRLSTLALFFTAPAMAAGPAWVATWQASPQPVWGTEFPFPTYLPGSLDNRTIRQVARVSLGGTRLRIVLSNTYGGQPVRVGKATVAIPGAKGAVVADSLRVVTFGGSAETSLPPGASLVSNPIALTLPALSQVAVSVYLPEATPVTGFHWDGKQTAWIAQGDQVAASGLHDATETTARPLLSGIQVETISTPRAVVVLGDSITDGASASLDKDRRWPDFLAARFAPRGIAVVNAGISGGRLLSDGMGVNALARLDRDVFAQPGVRDLVVMIGINDIAWPGTIFARGERRPTLEALQAGYRQLVAQAHLHGIRVTGATLTPFEGALPGTPMADYYDADKDALRKRLNEWIRKSDLFDAVIDFDALLRDPSHPDHLRDIYDSGDHLHPGDEGNKAMANAVNVEGFLKNVGSLAR
ncbi:MAG: hypothetical protein GAK28_03936 [Luteibacter sp.]|uniref:SGNH/GDSL hydrolase family protein n=1 Tax=Luteibacter sp. TaxID=1886636 RepID=UPI00138580A8|nr:SGNH/GDSL hydrolase family protein [Luteibacter sp.]KAF1004559.1 MAG: hypothetical protein GAK28_03936 [Luteibacter sp.]